MSAISRLLDRSIIFSFDRSGFNRHARYFEPSDMEGSYANLHAVVTGGNSGIGFATCESLLRRGVHVTLVGRNAKRTKSAVDTLKRTVGGVVAGAVCDLSDLGAVRALADELTFVDILLHNAGDMVHSLHVTPDGLECITATHVVGPYCLTEHLKEKKKLGGPRPSRVIFVSSGGMYSEPLNVKALNEFEGTYDGVAHYAKTKRAQVTLATYLNERYQADNINVASMHPGWVDTPALSRAMPTFKRFTHRILRTPEQGADTCVWLALCPLEKWGNGDRFFFDRQAVPVHLLQRTKRKSDASEVLVNFLEGYV